MSDYRVSKSNSVLVHKLWEAIAATVEDFFDTITVNLLQNREYHIKDVESYERKLCLQSVMRD